MKITRDGRTLHLTDMPLTDDISIFISYTGNRNEKKEIDLDQIIIPFIFDTLWYHSCSKPPQPQI